VAERIIGAHRDHLHLGIDALFAWHPP